MSRNFKHSWVIFPLLSILSLSPAELKVKHHSGRSLASVVSVVEQEQAGHTPRFDKLTSKVDTSNVTKSVTMDKFLEKTGKLNEVLQQKKASFKKAQNDKNALAQGRKELEAVVAEIVVLEEEMKATQEKQLFKNEEDKVFAGKNIVDFKARAEELLVDLESGEKQIALLEESKKEIKKDEVKQDELKKDEAKKDELNKDVQKVESPSVAKSEEKKEEKKAPAANESVVSEKKVEIKKEDDKKKEVVEESESSEEAKTEKKGKKEVACDADKNKVLSSSTEALIQNQNQIMQQMQQMSQMMMMQTMQMQQMSIALMQQQLHNGGPVNQQAYQYSAPAQNGQWVFQPTGGNRPSFYPDQMNQQPQPNMQQNYGGWNIGSDPRWNMGPSTPGSFNGPAVGYNLNSPLMATPTPTFPANGPAIGYNLSSQTFPI